MKRIRVTNRTRGVELVRAGQAAATPWSRLIGLLGQRRLERGDGLLLCGEQAIHTIGMRFPIDVLYLDRTARVLRAFHSLPPQRLAPFLRDSHNVLELPAGTLAETGTRVGDELTIEYSS